MKPSFSLARIIDPIAPAEFYRDYWEQKPLVVQRDARGYFSSLLSFDVVDHVVTALGLSHPEISMYNAMRDVPATAYTLPSGMIDVLRLYQQYADGSTIILQELHGRHEPLADLCRAMESELTHRFQANIYVSPENAQGFKAHYDSHDVFVLQVAGSKHWLLYDTPVQLPYRGQRFRPEVTKPGSVSMECTLHAGDMLYIPRGVMHDARTTVEHSIHVTLGALTTSWTDVILEAIAIVGLGDPDFRRALPPGYAKPGFDSTGAERFFRELLRRAAEKAEFAKAVEQFAEDFRSTRYPNVWGQMAQVERLRDVTPETRFRARPQLLMTAVESDEHFTVSCYGNTVRFPRHVAEPCRAALSGETTDVRSLPGSLDLDGRLVLVRRLVREGLAELV